MEAGVRELVSSSLEAFRRSPAFARAVLAQFLFLLGTYPLQRFLIYYLEDRFHLSDALRQAGGYLAVAICSASPRHRSAASCRMTSGACRSCTGASDWAEPAS